MTPPPIPIFAVHGKQDAKPITWNRSRVIFIDDDGHPWILGGEPYTIGTKFSRGEKALRRADSYSDYLGMSLDNERHYVISAYPGWRCLFGYIDDSGCDAWISDVAAWSVDEEGCMSPITVADMRGMEPANLYDAGVGNGLVRIFGPSEMVPSTDEQKEMVRGALEKQASIKQASITQVSSNPRQESK